MNPVLKENVDSKKLPVLNKASFVSSIEKLYYIWFKKPQVIYIVFLSSSVESFDDYIDRLRLGYSGLAFKDMRSVEIECVIADYLGGRLKSFSLEPCFFTGTAFEKKVWQATMTIPYGRVASYREIAEKAGFPGAWRAAGTALNHNPVMLVVPCHRVIKSSGRIGFFGGGEDLKEYLLDLEQKYVLCLK
jgi:O-6-methylguanine DNA methyltransferase